MNATSHHFVSHCFIVPLLYDDIYIVSCYMLSLFLLFLQTAKLKLISFITKLQHTMRLKFTIYTVVSILAIVLGMLCASDLRSQSKGIGLKTVVIDAGHGGKDPGGVSRDKSTYEKNLVLDIAKRFGSKIKEKYPNAVIICMTCWEVGGSANSAGNVCSAYGQALLDVCADMGIPCINAMDQKATGVYMTNADFRKKYCIGPNDISHLNADGMKLVFPFFEKTIAELYQASLS
jgi:hypothetical protein